MRVGLRKLFEEEFRQLCQESLRGGFAAQLSSHFKNFNTARLLCLVVFE
jgi:hypothetical protein